MAELEDNLMVYRFNTELSEIDYPHDETTLLNFMVSLLASLIKNKLEYGEVFPQLWVLRGAYAEVFCASIPNTEIMNKLIDYVADNFKDATAVCFLMEIYAMDFESQFEPLMDVAMGEGTYDEVQKKRGFICHGMGFGLNHVAARFSVESDDGPQYLDPILFESDQVIVFSDGLSKLLSK